MELADTAGQFDHMIIAEDILHTAQMPVKEARPLMDSCSANCIAIVVHKLDEYCTSGVEAAPSVDTVLETIVSDTEAANAGHSIGQSMAEEDDTS